jgi:hypothetical protein
MEPIYLIFASSGLVDAVETAAWPMDGLHLGMEGSFVEWRPKTAPNAASPKSGPNLADRVGCLLLLLLLLCFLAPVVTIQQDLILGQN